METNKVYVAIGKEVEERESTLRWVFKNFIGKTIFVIYVHVPAKKIPLPSGLELPVRLVKKNELEAFRAQESEKVIRLLDDCSQICAKFKVPCESTFVERDSVTEGILELINQLRIENLVMGASANNKYWRSVGMTKLMSEKAENVLQFAPDFCHIWFICNDHIVYKREGVMQQNPNVEEMPSNSSEIDIQHLGSSSPSKENHINDNLYNNLEQAISEAKSSWHDAFRKSVSCWNAEKQALEAIRKAKPAERLYYEELRLKKAMKEEEAENMKKTFTKVSFEHSEALDQKLSPESEIEKLNVKVKELEEKQVSEGTFSKNECNKLQIERDSAVKEAQELRKQLTAECSRWNGLIFSEFSHLDLQKATNYFDPSLKIGEGSHGSIYKGFLHHTEVAIKLLVSNYAQSQREFNERVSCISKLRHPNLVTLMGACREPWALVYEYLPSGPLSDRLIPHSDNTPSLPWKIRIRIAIGICSALIFLHSSNPTCTVQSDLTPEKLLLDANFTCRITDFGVVSNDTAQLKPEPYFVKPANFESDVYSFGIIVLQLLTGQKETSGIVKKMKYALREDTLDRILDPSAGDWPFVQTNQLAHMALMCCNKKIEKRPDLAFDVWRVLSPMWSSCCSLSLLSVASVDQPPHYFICPILQEVMEDPHFAADGFTYEAEAIRGWFESGHDTSPMTNMKLTSCNLTPNRALRSVIQEWLQMASTK